MVSLLVAAALAAAPWPSVALTRVAGGFSSPTQITSARDGSGRLFVVEQGGLVKIVKDGDPDVASLFDEQVLLKIPQPFANHNGGQLAFGPDGFLYVGMGDGGSAGDPSNNGQSLGTLLGKILRIDVRGSASPYGIPPGNPFAGSSSSRREIWAYGLRNPWRFSFDRKTGNLFIGDVGQGAWEEVDFQPAAAPGGANCGWRVTEGAHCYNPATGCSFAGITLPVAEYGHGGGNCSITGGFVYRGRDFARLGHVVPPRGCRRTAVRPDGARRRGRRGCERRALRLGAHSREPRNDGRVRRPDVHGIRGARLDGQRHVHDGGTGGTTARLSGRDPVAA